MGNGNGDELRSLYGSDGDAGNEGENRFHEHITRTFGERYRIYRSQTIPRSPGQVELRGDIDFVVANGSRVWLVDVKLWASSSKLWRLPNWFEFTLPGIGQVPRFAPMNGRQPIRNHNGEWALSRNMAAALERVSEHLPGRTVRAMVVFLASDNRDRTPWVLTLPWSRRIPSVPAWLSFYLLEWTLGATAPDDQGVIDLFDNSNRSDG